MSVSRIVSFFSVTATAMACLCLTGCTEPQGMVTAAPPGIDLRSTMVKKEAEEPVALGEAVAQSGATLRNPVQDIPPALPTAKGESKTTNSGVTYETIKEGAGAAAKPGQRVRVHYTGKLDDGRIFDSSRPRGEPSEFDIGVGSVIKGWDEAVVGMKIGEIRKLTIPPAAGYGALGSGSSVPPNATLHFEIELLDTK